MRTNIMRTRLTLEERETHIYRTDDGWLMDSTIPKDYKVALKKGWVPVMKTVYEDGSICGYVLKGKECALSFRKNEKRPCTLTEEQKTAAAERMRKLRTS